MRAIYLLLLVTFIGVGSWWVYQNSDSVHQFAQSYAGKEDTEFLALEPRYSVDQILSAHRSELPENRTEDNLEPALKLFPYLLVDVAYNQSDKKNREGVILWNMNDGEMVINTENWDATKGFGKLLAANADKNDFRIVKTLSARGGQMTRDQLVKSMKQPPDMVEDWLESARSKGLIAQEGNIYRLRTSETKLNVAPVTNISQRLVTKPYNHVKRAETLFSKEQIQEAASAAFGPEITIRNVREVYLPVYVVSLANEDGTVQSTLWNALNGQRYTPKALSTPNRGQ